MKRTLTAIALMLAPCTAQACTGESIFSFCEEMNYQHFRKYAAVLKAQVIEKEKRQKTILKEKAYNAILKAQTINDGSGFLKVTITSKNAMGQYGSYNVRKNNATLQADAPNDRPE
jgi:hypothetical protein